MKAPVRKVLKVDQPRGGKSCGGEFIALLDCKHVVVIPKKLMESPVYTCLVCLDEEMTNAEVAEQINAMLDDYLPPKP